jgi:DNA-3-methyladenine glycosylase I
MPKEKKEKIRCPWAPLDKPLYVQYHDTEWGVPVRDDVTHFEFLVLEGAQAGLSWYTILCRREGYRKAFKNFDPRKVARMSDEELEKLMQNPGIIRNRLKIYAARQNARVFLAIQKEFGSFNKYVWSFVGGKPIVHACRAIKDIPATSPHSDALSKDLKKRGMKFVGSTIMYAHMQATGLINDHLTTCWRYRVSEGK